MLFNASLLGSIGGHRRDASARQAQNFQNSASANKTELGAVRLGSPPGI
jgi:hypothetical protein